MMSPSIVREKSTTFDDKTSSDSSVSRRPARRWPSCFARTIESQRFASLPSTNGMSRPISPSSSIRVCFKEVCPHLFRLPPLFVWMPAVGVHELKRLLLKEQRLHAGENASPQPL